MAFSDLGKLLKITEEVLKVVERNHLTDAKIQPLKEKIYQLKQKEQFM